ncbi:glycoside hydrolase family 97 protein [Acidaminobacter sp. JC074]|uniref:glycoside hydrolase family 97 protein n=1 Tax=Acidaminobacter sp. JC074 TaxID=2530199 RepID=UPI001F0FCB58|nr:glycoside hydrolase family 97 protein [Acidaminobacter sp. JC074]MCH4889845.1 glycoside hydrolase family 97 protein [Acidaminobacter sp. JC074]
MKKVLLLFISILLSFSMLSCEEEILSLEVSSPDDSIKVVIHSQEDLTYEVTYKDEKIILPSELGFEFESIEPMTSFNIMSFEQVEVNDSWTPVWGQRSNIDNHYNELKVVLEEKSSKKVLDLYFRVFNDGLGFRYIIPKQEGINEIHVMDELTQFKIAEDAKTWWIRNDWDSYEYLYKETSLSEVKDASTPLTMKFPSGTHVSIHEAALVDYAGMALRHGGDLNLESHLAPWPDGVKVKASETMTTPWRTITIADDAGGLADSSLILNLNEPSQIKDASWITPMKYMGIWWEMHIKKSDWGRHNLNHGATTENAKYYIDFIEKYLSDDEPIGLLVEGWNQGWDGNWIENYDLFKFTEDGEYEDFDVSEVVAYGQERNVEYIMHNETSGGIENYEASMDDAYSDYQRLSINAIKSGYVADGGMKQPRGQHHHGQYMVNHYNNAVKKAAEYQIVINTHEPIKATGLSRTYPNWVAREGVQGMEYNAWSEGNPPEHTTILPFTRILGGPIDYTPGIFDVTIDNGTYRVHTTRAKQLALYVILYSPLQMITDLPENYLDDSSKPYEEFKFVQDVAVDWDESKIISAEIGDYVMTARKTKGKDEWFVGCITDEESRELSLPLDFLGEGLYTAEVYTDDTNTDYLTNPNNVATYKLLVDNTDVLPISLSQGGGTAIRLYPSSQEEQDSLVKYIVGNISVKDIVMKKSIQSNDLFEVTLSIENTSGMTLGIDMPFMMDDELIETKYMRIKPHSTETYTFSKDDIFEPGTYQIEVGDLLNETLVVDKKEASLELIDFEVFVNTNKAMARVKVLNSGYEAGEKNLVFKVNDQVIEEKLVEVESAPGGKTKGITFRFDLSQTGIYKIQINDLIYELNHTVE